MTNSAYQRLITPTLLSHHIEALIEIEPIFAIAYQQTATPTLRLRDGGFTHLLQTIVSQQLSVAAANGIWQRLQQAELTSESAIIAASDEKLREQGLSKQKIRYAKSLAQHQIDYDLLNTQDDESVIETLTAVTGIGRWTAEIYCLFSLNRCDVFAANDLALQAASQALFNLNERPKEKAMREMAKAWSPHRSAAAYLLWAYYHVIKQRESIGT